MQSKFTFLREFITRIPWILVPVESASRLFMHSSVFTNFLVLTRSSEGIVCYSVASAQVSGVGEMAVHTPSLRRTTENTRTAENKIRRVTILYRPYIR
jgi:hypothetical protein